MKTMMIQGMHCDACKKLITMELQDAGLDEHMVSLEVTKEQMGTLTLEDAVSDGVVQKIQHIIEQMEGYSVSSKQ